MHSLIEARIYTVNTWYVNHIIKESTIEGKGQFATEKIAHGTMVLKVGGNIHHNENNSFVNHSIDNNINWDGANNWVANKDIEEGEEITMDYRQWVMLEVPDDHWLNRTH